MKPHGKDFIGPKELPDFIDNTDSRTPADSPWPRYIVIYNKETEKLAVAIAYCEGRLITSDRLEIRKVLEVSEPNSARNIECEMACNGLNRFLRSATDKLLIDVEIKKANHE